MKERIINAMKNSNASVIFENKYTGKVKFFNGLIGNFDFITRSMFEELKKEGTIKPERCICQGETRYIFGG